MKQQAPLHHLLEEIAAISSMEPGKISIIRQGPKGPYFNHQRRVDGRNVTEYVPADQIEELQANIEAHQRFEEIIARYESAVCEQSRLQRKAGIKKKLPMPASHSHRKPKSKRS